MARGVDLDEARSAFEGRKLSNGKFADEFGITMRQASRIRKRLGLSKPASTTRAQPGWEEKAERLLEDSASYMEVARTLLVSTTTLRRKFPGYGMSAEEANEVRKANQGLEKSLEIWGL